MSRSTQARARQTVRSMGDFARACEQMGISAKKIVVSAIRSNQDVGPYAQAALAMAKYDTPQPRVGKSSGF